MTIVDHAPKMTYFSLCINRTAGVREQGTWTTLTYVIRLSWVFATQILMLKTKERLNCSYKIEPFVHTSNNLHAHAALETGASTCHVIPNLNIERNLYMVPKRKRFLYMLLYNWYLKLHVLCSIDLNLSNPNPTQAITLVTCAIPGRESARLPLVATS
jgi:hypothetical protein